MKAFHNDENVKQKYVARVLAHQKADRLIQGITAEYSKGGGFSRGCAVGCTLEKYEHAAYETELGVPEWLAILEDAVFEGLPKDKALLWPSRFLEAIPLGADLDKIKTPFLIFILEQNLKYLEACKFDEEKNPDVKKAIDGSRIAVVQMIAAHKSGDGIEAAWSADSAARSAAWSADSAAWSAAFEFYADKLIELIKGA